LAEFKSINHYVRTSMIRGKNIANFSFSKNYI